MVDDRSVRTAIAGYIRENFLYARPDYALREDARLLDEGIVDSMGAVELVAFLEDQFGVSIPDDEITEDNFGTIASIAQFVGRKLLTAA
jgi:acyl carrier protein